MDDFAWPPSTIRVCPGVRALLSHHLGNAGAGGGGTLSLVLRRDKAERFLSPRDRNLLERTEGAIRRVLAVSRALQEDVTLCPEGRACCDGGSVCRGEVARAAPGAR